MSHVSIDWTASIIYSINYFSIIIFTQNAPVIQ